MKQPEAYIDFEVYEGKTNFVGVAKATLPNINFLTQTITGAGISGNIEAVLTGMVDTMNLSLEFRSATDAAVKLMTPKKHNVELRVAEQYWNTTKQAKEVMADKYVLVIMPKNFTPGAVAPASAADTSGEYSVYYFAGYKDGKQLWEIDPWNYKCTINGKDYMADVRKALGK